MNDQLLSAGDPFAEPSLGQNRDYAALSKAVSLFNEHASNVLTSVLNKSIVFETVSCTAAKPSDAAAQLPIPLLAVTIPLQGDISGEVQMIFTKKDVAVLSDLMMMGDGTAPFSEEHKDAVMELVNQILGAYLKALRDETGKSITAGQLSVSDFDFGQPGFDPTQKDMAIQALTIEGVGSTALGMFFDQQIGMALTSVLSGQESSPSGLDTPTIGLSAAELDDLAKVTADTGSDFFEDSSFGARSPSSNQGIDMLLDIDLDVSIELGGASLSVKRILELAPGSIVELDKMAGEPVDLLVNGKVVAKGEVVVVDENFGVRIVSLVSAEDRIRSLR